MSAEILSIFHFVPRDMGQCPNCMGYRVQMNMENLFPDEDLYGDNGDYDPGLYYHPQSTGLPWAWLCKDCGLRW